jgi:hypothetical protein
MHFTNKITYNTAKEPMARVTIVAREKILLIRCIHYCFKLLFA